ncbi:MULTISPECIES: hypothetical protein [Frankiaceae]|uniref:hypothetical protein n=1 Tax=Frankiaceae TaxID=74712 RepID=UPI0013A5D298|nr:MULTISPECIES: hypothetical protein [Frankiaceae]MBE3201974.1 hypothetical protein [Parafrankia sp. CH37]
MAVTRMDDRQAAAEAKSPLLRQRNTWLRRLAGLSAGGLLLGLIIGLLLPR